MPRGVMRHPRYLFRSDYGPLLIYLTGKFSYISIAIGLAWGVGESLIEKNRWKKSRTQTLPMNTVICFFLSFVFNMAGVPS